MNERTQIFDYGEISLRTVTGMNETWFAAKDVCEVLDLTNPTVSISRLDEDEVTKFNLGGLSGETNFVNEAGLYALILGSRKPEAKQFKRWITHEVLPSIRRTGQYVKPLSEKEQLLASMKLTLEAAEEIAVVKEDVFGIKNEMREVRTLVDNQITLHSGEQRRVQKAINCKVYETESDQERRKVLFRELHREVKDRFGVASYKDIKRKELQSAIRYIEAWVPRRSL